MSKPGQQSSDVLGEEVPTMTNDLSNDDQRSLNADENSERTPEVNLEDIRTAGL